MSHHPPRAKTYLLCIAILLIFIFIVYSLYTTLKSGSVKDGVVVCPEEGTCFWQAHIHGYMPIMLCGEELRLPIEKGSLQGPHTHEEENIMHWHDRTPYDVARQRRLDDRPFTLGSFFDSISIPFNQYAIDDKENGDFCPDGSIGTLKMFVNGEESTLYREYLWKDKDTIYLVFDNRTAAEIAEELRRNPIRFPALGRG